jgi:hydrogenase nickel incorporation protein HypB
VNPGVEVLFTSARRGEGVGLLLDRALAAADGGAVHEPVMTRTVGAGGHGHSHEHGHSDEHGQEHSHEHSRRPGHEHGHAPAATRLPAI